PHKWGLKGMSRSEAFFSKYSSRNKNSPHKWGLKEDEGGVEGGRCKGRDESSLYRWGVEGESVRCVLVS
ncbi:MAG: hypothetical protein QXZ24_06900, partial [Candidatus Jordarchaeales archaeon]